MSVQPYFVGDEAKSLSQFPGKIPVPSVPPDFQTVNVGISCEWLPYVAGACRALLAEAVWQTASEAELITVLNRVEDLLVIFEVAGQAAACEAMLPPFACPYTFDLGLPFGWTLIDESPYAPPFFGQLGFGTGWSSTCSLDVPDGGITTCGIAIQKIFSPAIRVSSVDAALIYAHGVFSSPYYGVAISAIYLGVLVAQLLVTDSLTPGGFSVQTLSFTEQLIDTIQVEFFCDKNTSGLQAGNCRCDTITIIGSGTPPSDCG